MLNLSVILDHSARKYPNKTAFTFMDTDLSYSQINGAACQVANSLRSIGIEKGDKVALSCFNLPFFPILYFGILKAGAAVVPLSVLLKQDEIAYHLNDSDAKAYFCFVGTEELPMGKMGKAGFDEAPNCEHFFLIMPKPEMPSPIAGVKTFAELIKNQPPKFETALTSAEDTAVLIYSSGTTGKPKGAELTHLNLLQNAILCADFQEITPNDTILIVLPLFHIFAMTVLMNAGIYRGAKNVLLPKFEPESVFALMQKHKVTIFGGVPTMYWGLNHYYEPKFDYDSIAQNLKVCVSGGASLPLQVLQDFENRFNVQILEGYGMSEGSPVVTFNQNRANRKVGSIGTPVWGVEVKLVDSEGNEVPAGEKGEIVYRGHNVMKGYYKKPEATAETIKDGWLHSGDIAIKDDEGFYYIVDRTKDLIIRGGFNVYPREVEELIIQHEAVSLVAVIGVPCEQMGEEIKACVVLKSDTIISEQDLIYWTKERIAAYKYPRIIEFMDALPMTATGKILKRELRK